jgi:hypothetical protein
VGCGGLANHQTSSPPTAIQQKKQRFPNTMFISPGSPPMPGTRVNPLALSNGT